MCSSAARLRIRPALISDNAKLIRMRVEITAEKMLPNQKQKQPEGALKHLGDPAAGRGLSCCTQTANTSEEAQCYSIWSLHTFNITSLA